MIWTKEDERKWNDPAERKARHKYYAQKFAKEHAEFHASLGDTTQWEPWQRELIDKYRNDKTPSAYDFLENLANICCEDFAKACEEGTDHEGYNAAIGRNGPYREQYGPWRVGCGLAALRFCPWCGKPLDQTI